MFRIRLTIAIGLIIALAACNTSQNQKAETASVRVGVSPSALASQDVITPQGVPTDPTTGLTGVTEAELTVFKDGVQVYFDASGNQVDTEPESTPIILTDTASSRVLLLYHGTYDFHVDARDNAANILATGELNNTQVIEDTTITIPLTSIIDSATLDSPVTVVPNQIFDVFLTVHPPARTDLNLPTTDYDSNFVNTGGNILGQSDLGVRVQAECEEISIQADIYAPNDTTTVVTSANQVIPMESTCPTAAGTIGVDLVPPYVEFTEPADNSTVTPTTYVQLFGNVADAQSGIDLIEIYDGVVLIGSTTSITPPAGGNPYSTWEFHNFWEPLDIRTYHLTVVATDNAGNQSQDTVTFTIVE